MQMCRRNNTSKIWDRFPGVGDWQLLCDHCFDCLLLRCTWAIEVLRHMSLQVNFTPSSPGTRSRLDLRILMRSSLAGVLLFYQVWSRSSPVLLSYPTQWCLVALTTMNHLVIVGVYLVGRSRTRHLFLVTSLAVPYGVVSYNDMCWQSWDWQRQM